MTRRDLRARWAAFEDKLATVDALHQRSEESLLDHVNRLHGGFWDCSSCCVGSPADEWRQEGDGWRCPDCGRNVATPLPHEDARAVPVGPE